MGIAAYLKEIGRGRQGARSLDVDQARDLMAQVLDRRVSEAERGAFAVAMRIKGESTEELLGFTAAAQSRCMALEPGGDEMPIVLPSYNGARKLPNLTALLAKLLAREGLPVLVHGVTQDPARVTTHELFARLGWPVAQRPAAVHKAWARGEPAFVPIDVLCPALADLLALRSLIGLRNPGHTVAKLLAPGARPSLRVVNHTHPEYAQAQARFLERSGAHALLMRGTEGEPVADARRARRLDVFIAGALRPDLGREGQEGSLNEVPLLPRGLDAAATAAWILDVSEGRVPLPAPLRSQCDVLGAAQRAARRCEAARHERSP